MLQLLSEFAAGLRATAGLLCAAVLVSILLRSYSRLQRARSRQRLRRGPFAEQGITINAAPATFRWEHTAPRKFRPFKDKYNLTMGISRPAHDDWLLLENTYGDWTAHHRAVFSGPYASDMGLVDEADTEAVLAVEELYDHVTSFLAARYPHYFVIEPSRREKHGRDMLHNTILGTEMPLTAAAARACGASARDLFRILAENTEEDFLLMGFDADVDEYRLRACTGVAATGFLWRSRLGMPLTQLHGPIPNYKEKLQLSMNRYFRKMAPGAIVQRSTFKVQFSKHDEVFKPQSSADPLGSAPAGPVDFTHGAFMRLERQQLFRLPKSNFILFTIRTYMYPLSEIKAEGLGPALAQTVRAWPDDFAAYKRRNQWENVVYEYLEDGNPAAKPEAEDKPEHEGEPEHEGKPKGEPEPVAARPVAA